MTDEGLCRVGWSTQNATLELGGVRGVDVGVRGVDVGVRGVDVGVRGCRCECEGMIGVGVCFIAWYSLSTRQR